MSHAGKMLRLQLLSKAAPFRPTDCLEPLLKTSLNLITIITTLRISLSLLVLLVSIKPSSFPCIFSSFCNQKGKRKFPVKTMVLIALGIKVILDNVTNLRPDGEDFRWYLKLKCLNCGEETKTFVYLTLLNSVPLKGGRGSACMVAKCKLCSRENSVDILRDSIKAYNIEASGRFQKIVSFECRGIEPTDFSPRGGWLANGAESSSTFEIDLTEKEWYDFDEKSSNPVSIVEFEHQFTRA